MRICDENWDDPSGGSHVDFWPSKQPPNLAISIADQYDDSSFHTATLSPQSCFALGNALLDHARRHGVPYQEVSR